MSSLPKHYLVLQGGNDERQWHPDQDIKSNRLRSICLACFAVGAFKEKTLDDEWKSVKPARPTQ